MFGGETEGRNRMKKYQQVSPERTKVWTERSPKYHQCRKVPVVYYLCRNRHLEHPHFMEVPLSSPEGLFLRDVIDRLNALRGRGIASLYSWSCKRSYKTGFVWHDLCEDDLILPSHGNEYVLKGSELFEESNSGLYSPMGNVKVRRLKQLPEPVSSRSLDDYSSSSSLNGKEEKHSQDDDISPPLRRPGSSAVSPEYGVGKNSPWTGPLSLTEYKVHKCDGASDAATQTEENGSRPKAQETCTRGVCTDDAPSDPEPGGSPNQLPCKKEESGGCRDSVSPPPSSSSASSSGGRTETLESLIRADASKISSFRILEEDEFRVPSKLKPSNVLMQLISCGSISVKDHSFGLIPTYKQRVSHSKFPSPLFSTSVMFGELDCLSDKPRLMGLKLEDKEYFSGSLIETKTPKEEGNNCSTLKRSSSYNADRNSQQPDSTPDKDEPSSVRTKCIPRSIKGSTTKHPRAESMRSPVSDGPRISADGINGAQIIVSSASDNGSKRHTDPNSSSKRMESSFREEDNVFKIEERLASGARVIIQSKT